MDIWSKAPFPAGQLSNFAPHEFEFDGVACSSMESLLQSFKFPDVADQVTMCALPASHAKNRGRLGDWKPTQTLWWGGKPYERQGAGYQRLLDRAYSVLARHPGFVEALRATGDELLTHRRGSADPSETVLTEDELCRRLMMLRDALN